MTAYRPALIILFYLGAAMVLVGIVVDPYCGWAQDRARGLMPREDHLIWPIGWPYPDQWLDEWEKCLDAQYPCAPGCIKWNGEYPMIRGCLEIVIIVVRVMMFVGMLLMICTRRSLRRFSAATQE